MEAIVEKLDKLMIVVDNIEENNKRFQARLKQLEDKEPVSVDQRVSQPSVPEVNDTHSPVTVSSNLVHAETNPVLEGAVANPPEPGGVEQAWSLT